MGSSAKGTAMKGRKEVDLVVVFPDFSTEFHLYQKDLVDLQALLNSSFPDVPVRKDMFSLLCKIHNYDVDISMGGDLHPRDLLALTSRHRRLHRASCVKYATEFIRNQPSFYKDVVRLVKHWRDGLEWKTEKPKSYSLELLVLAAYQKRRSETSYRTHFINFLHLVTNHKSLDLFWTAYYKANDVSKENPRLIDPANPKTNFYRRFRGWEELATHAKQTLLIMGSPAGDDGDSRESLESNEFDFSKLNQKTCSPKRFGKIALGCCCSCLFPLVFYVWIFVFLFFPRFKMALNSHHSTS